MAVKCLLLVFLMLELATSEDEKRLVLHSDLDISSVINELRQEISATQQENAVLKAQMTELNQTSKAQMTELNQTLKAQMAQELQVLQTKMTQENVALEAKFTKLKRGQGSTYVRWGRIVCDGNDTLKVYSGYAAGSAYNIAGGSSSNLCLPESPSWATYKDGIQDIGGYLYGTEYQTHEEVLLPFGKRMTDEDVPCVLCHSTKTTNVMIPGKTTCYPGWTMEYTGYLMTNHHTYSGGADYACVDKNPEAVLHGEDNKNGHLFYFTEVQCGSLPCQEYPQGRELACVVCSK